MKWGYHHLRKHPCPRGGLSREFCWKSELWVLKIMISTWKKRARKSKESDETSSLDSLPKLLGDLRSFGTQVARPRLCFFQGPKVGRRLEICYHRLDRYVSLPKNMSSKFGPGYFLDLIFQYEYNLILPWSPLPESGIFLLPSTKDGVTFATPTRPQIGPLEKPQNSRVV